MEILHGQFNADLYQNRISVAAETPHYEHYSSYF